MPHNRYFLALTIGLCGFYACAPARAQITGVINTYARVTAYNAGLQQLTISTPRRGGAGVSIDSFNLTLPRTALIIQMKGASVNTTADPTVLAGSAYGTLTAEGNAGRYEYVSITAVTGSGPYTITLAEPLTNSYDFGSPGGYVQLVHLPQYGNVTIGAAGITGDAWDSTNGTGGIIGFNSTGIVTLNGNVNADGIGYRGGVVSGNFYTVGDCHENFPWATTVSTYGGKGESVARFNALSYGRGRWANGGGGGSRVNGGGGGGGNASAGGIGTDAWNGTTPIGTPPCAVAVPPAPNHGSDRAWGLGGSVTTSTSADRLFMGGGGGGGQQNNSAGSAGARGGGIILIRARVLVNSSGAARSISANGATPATSGNDGSGGGGAGGSIFLDATDYNPASPCGANTVTVSVNGGNGAATNTHPGTGGGGGVGYLYVGPSGTPTSCYTFSATPGQQGQVCNPGCSTPPGGSPGGNSPVPDCPPTCSVGPVTPPGPLPPLPIVLVSFSALRAGSDVELRWLVASELNNSHFALERSVAGQPFAFVGTVMGRGTSSTPHTYAYRDIEVPSGALRYRLRQIDFDGTETIYGPVVVSAAEGAPELTLLRNPARSGEPVLVQLSGARPGQRLELVDLAGRVLAYHLMSGDGLVLLRAHDLSPGVYIVRLQGTKLSQRLLVE